MEHDSSGGLVDRIRTTRPRTLVALAVPVAAAVGALTFPSIAAAEGGHGSTPDLAAAHPALVAPAAAAASAAPHPQRAAVAPPVGAGTGAPASTTGDDSAMGAFFDHGYTYDDAAKLAAAWKFPVVRGDLSEVKIAAGRNLLAGLPVATQPKESPATVEQRVQAFARAGYHLSDAVLLARMWGDGLTPAQAKVAAGTKLLATGHLPTTPGQTAQTVGADVAEEAFFDNGLSYEDAARLAKAWHIAIKDDDASPVKVIAGRRILAGEHLTPGH